MGSLSPKSRQDVNLNDSILLRSSNSRNRINSRSSSRDETIGLVSETENDSNNRSIDVEDPHTLYKPSAPPLNSWKLFCLVGFWFAYHYFNFIYNIVMMPSQIQTIMGNDNKGSGISTITLLSGIFFLFLAPIAGAVNDQFSSPYGRRSPWIMIGLIIMCISLFSLRRTFPLYLYTLMNLILSLGSIICSVPYNGLISDVTNESQSHIISAYIGGSNLVGYLLGAISGVFADVLGDDWMSFVIVTVSLLTSSLTLVFIQEPPRHFHPSSATHATLPFGIYIPVPNLIELGRSILRPLWINQDFRLVFLSRFLFQLGIASLQQFLQYWILDCVDTNGMSPTRAVSIGLIPNLLLAPICAMLLPASNRKRVVYLSSCFMIAASLLVMFSNTFNMTLLISGLFGIGYGPFLSVEFAMLMDVLPNAERDAARDMSLWHSALVLPQIIATPLAGWVLDALQQFGKAHGKQCLGYQTIYGITIVYFLAGVFVTKFIQNVK